MNAEIQVSDARVGFWYLPLSRIHPSPTNPRRHFDPAALEELAASIKEKGVLQPVLVRTRDHGATLIAGIAGVSTEEAQAVQKAGVVTLGDLRRRADELEASGKVAGCKADTRLYAAARCVPGVSAAAAKAIERTAAAQPAGGWEYELVYGERRYRAAKLAGLEEIPAVVREMTDQAVLETQIVENEQREDVTALEKAAGYQRLIAQHGYTVEQVAEKVAKSPSTVRGLLKLLRLPEPAREALEAGTLQPAVAQLIAARPSDVIRRKVAEFALHPSEAWNRRGELPSYREVKEHVERECMVELKQAPFSQKDAALVEGAGACTDCPKRSGNNREEFPDGRADVCTDPECFRAKVKAHGDRLVAAARAEGKTVLQGKAAKGLFSQYSPGVLDHDSDYIDLDTNCYEGPRATQGQTKTWRKLIGKHVAADVVLAYDAKGVLHYLVLKTAAHKSLKEHHGVADSERESASQKAWKREQAEQRRKAEAGKAASLRANGAVAERAQRTMKAMSWTGEAVELLRALAMILPEVLWNDACRRVRQRRGLPKGDDRAVVRAEAIELPTAPELLALVAELIAARVSESWGSSHFSEKLSNEQRAFWVAWGIDPTKLRKEVEAERKAAKGKKKVKSSANGKPAPTAEAKPAITRDTFLIDLLTGDDVSKQGRALKDHGAPTVGILLDRIGKAKPHESYSSKLYAHLRGIQGIDVGAANQIGDALVDAGLVGVDGPNLSALGPSSPKPEVAPGGRR